MKSNLLLALLSLVLVGGGTKSSAQTNAPAKTEKPVDLVAMFKMHWDNQVRLFKEQNQV
jgi:hypothetical protein